MALMVLPCGRLCLFPGGERFVSLCGRQLPNTINPDGTYPLVNNIARWNGTTWSALVEE